MTITQDEAFARIRLLRTANVGPTTYRYLLRRFANAEAALAAMPDLAERGGRRLEPASPRIVQAEIQAVRKLGARYIFHDDRKVYPDLLAEAPGAPPILIGKGDISVLTKPAVAIVGARNASAAARKLAKQFAEELAGEGRVVVSGLARGIDGAAHEGALAANGATCAVVAGGVDVVYPPEHEALHDRIEENGLVLSEQPPGLRPQARHFPRRNRIIAGLCAGTVVVEAAPRSGSLITARLAGEAGREVMAVPGSPLEPRSRGCNQLIRDGAVLVQSAEDIAELLDGFTGEARSRFREEADAYTSFGSADELTSVDEDLPTDRLAGLLSTAPVAVDELVRASGGSAGGVQMALVELELAGRIERHAGGRVSLRPETSTQGT